LKVGIGFVIALAFILPIIWMIFVSIKPNGFTTTDVIRWFTPPFTISNYVDILVDSLIIRWTFNSFIIALITTILTLILTSLAAVSFSEILFRFIQTLFVFLLLGLMIPGVATIIALQGIGLSLIVIDSNPCTMLPSSASSLGVIILNFSFDGVANGVTESAIM